MADFTDLVFQVHPNLPEATQAWFDFPNGYAISVVTGPYAYTSSLAPYEAAVMQGGVCVEDTPLTPNVMGHLTTHGVTFLMGQIAALPKISEE